MKNNRVYILHMRDSILRITEYTKNINIELFLDNHLVQDGVIRQLEIIGEAANKLSAIFIDENKHIPWKDIIGMRNKLIHDYMGTDMEVVWNTIQFEIPYLDDFIYEYLKENE
jgi:uncharacterized protein with HEPN domain